MAMATAAAAPQLRVRASAHVKQSNKRSGPRNAVISSGARTRTAVRCAAGPGEQEDAPPTFDDNWLQASPVVFGASFLGWVIPASIPTKAINGGDSLVGAFSKAIAKGLQSFPNPPPVNDELWLYMVAFHVPLFTMMLLGQIGVQGRKRGYFR